MERPAYEEALAQMLAERTGTRAEDWYLTYRARHGMLAAFRALAAVSDSTEVATQLFTCCTAVDPILAAGLTPVYGEVSDATCSLDPARLELSPSTLAVMLQHTFGIVNDASSIELARVAHGVGALVVEDCAHCVARMARDVDGKPVADFSVHSFGVEKMLSTLHGGAVWVNPDSPMAELISSVRAELEGLPAPEARHERLNRSYRNTNRVLVHLPAAVSRPLRRALTGIGRFDPAVSEDERRGLVSHEPVRATRFACESALAALRSSGDDIDRRRNVVAAYREQLARVSGIEIPSAVLLGVPQPLLRFPVVCASTERADELTHAVCAAGFYTSTWYRPELGPGVLDEAAYHVPVDRTRLAVSDRLVACMANLPCDVSIKDARRIAAIACEVASS
jgi:dTDP-4-amino-4,6-dideoxygalactose transaminase